MLKWQRRGIRLFNAIAHGLVASAYPVNHGGLGVALAKVAIAGQLGMDITLPGRMRQDAFLFSETLGRIIVTVAPDHKRAFEQTVSADAILLGKTGGTKLRITGQELFVDQEIKKLEEAIKRPSGGSDMPAIQKSPLRPQIQEKALIMSGYGLTPKWKHGKHSFGQAWVPTLSISTI